MKKLLFTLAAILTVQLSFAQKAHDMKSGTGTGNNKIGEVSNVAVKPTENAMKVFRTLIAEVQLIEKVSANIDYKEFKKMEAANPAKIQELSSITADILKLLPRGIILNDNTLEWDNVLSRFSQVTNEKAYGETLVGAEALINNNLFPESWEKSERKQWLGQIAKLK